LDSYPSSTNTHNPTGLPAGQGGSAQTPNGGGLEEFFHFQPCVNQFSAYFFGAADEISTSLNPTVEEMKKAGINSRINSTRKSSAQLDYVVCFNPGNDRHRRSWRRLLYVIDHAGSLENMSHPETEAPEAPHCQFKEKWICA